MIDEYINLVEEAEFITEELEKIENMYSEMEMSDDDKVLLVMEKLRKAKELQIFYPKKSLKELTKIGHNDQ